MTAQKMQAKEKEALVLEYMRHMDDSKKRNLFSQLEKSLRSALTLLDGNAQNRLNGSQPKIGEGYGGSSPSLNVPMDVSGVMEPHPSNPCQ